MAYDPTINIQFDGTKKLIHVFNIDATKDGSTGTTTIDVSALAKSQRNQACNRISLNKIWYNVMLLQLQMVLDLHGKTLVEMKLFYL